MRIALLCAALVFVGCSKQEPAAKPTQTTKVSLPSGASVKPPKFKGSSATLNGIKTDVTVTADGQYDIWFMDPTGDDMPAAALSDVKFAVAKNAIPVQINDTGETWMGKGAPSNDPQLVADVAFTWRGTPYTTNVTMTSANLPLDYVCPMDPDVRSASPGVCSRCGMTLVLGVPDADAYTVDLNISPKPLRAGQKAQVTLHAEDPKTGKTVTKFEIVHEKLWHFFIVSADLKFFVHGHPNPGPNGAFRMDATFPTPGMYRVLSDFYPSGGTPQLIPQTVFVPGAGDTALPAPPVQLTADLTPKKGDNTGVELVLDPPHPVAGARTRLLLKLTPGDGIEKYLGAWAHMLAASDDLIDLLHEHPYSSDGAKEILFDMRLPRAHTYRMWIQFQRKGVVNTVAFNVPVAEQ